MKRTTYKSLILAIILSISLMTVACGNNNTNDSKNSTNIEEGTSSNLSTGVNSSSPSGSDANKKPGKGEKIVVFATNWIIKDNDRIQIYKDLVKEKLGYELEIINPPYQEAADKLNTMLASGEQIDLIWKSTPGSMLELAEKGYLLPLDEMLEASTQLTPDKWTGRDFIESASFEDSIYALPLMKATGYIPTINKAWLDKLSLPIPKTFEELNTTLVAFKEAKLGGDATIPLAHQWAYGDHVASFLGMWGLETPGVMMDENGVRFHPWLTSEGAEGIQWLQDMYKAGILDPEFPTAQEEPMRQKVINGMVGIFMDWPGANYDMNTKSMEANALSNMVAMEQIAAIKGTPAVTPGNTICMWMISKTSKNPEAAFRLLEFWNTEEGAILFSLQEGYDYTVKDGVMVTHRTAGKVSKQRLITSSTAMSTTFFSQLYFNTKLYVCPRNATKIK